MKLVRVSLVVCFSLLLPARSWAYEEADHFYLTMTAARLAGLSDEDALQVASAAVAVDESPGSNPKPNRWKTMERGEVPRMLAAQSNLHALAQLGSETAVLEKMNSLYETARHDNNLYRLGVYSHFVGDFNAHQENGHHFNTGVGHGICALHSHNRTSDQVQINVLKKLATFDIAEAARDVVVNQATQSHWVDQMSNRPEENRRTLKQIYFAIQKFAKDTGRELHPPVKQTKAMELINTFRAKDEGKSDEFLSSLNQHLAKANVTIPPYSARQGGIAVDVTGNPIRLQITAESLKSDDFLPVPTGPREEHYVDQKLYEVATSKTTLTGFPASPEIATRIDAIEHAANEKGVRIRYDTNRLRAALLKGGIADSDQPDPAADEILRQVAQDSANLAVPLGGRLFGISMLRLTARALEPEAQALGGLTRLAGYVADTKRGDVVILGLKTSDQGATDSSLTLDDLVVSLRHIWKLGKYPLCSLDPKPGQPIEAGFLSRVEGVPKDSRFGRVMLDADYAMKRIHLGLDRPALNDFKSVFDYQVEQATIGLIEGARPAGHISRFWLTPVQPLDGDILVSEKGRLVFFTSRVQVLTEVMLMAKDGLIGTKQMDPAEEKGCLEFTRRYADIAAARPDFAQLQALFDLTLMASLLREHLPAYPALEQLSRLPVTPVPMRDEKYSVLWSDLGGRPFYVGGVDVAFPEKQRAIAALTGSSHDLASVTEELIRTRDTETAQRPRDRFFLEAIKTFWTAMGQAKKQEARATLARFKEAESLLGDALQNDPEYAAAYLFRAFIRINHSIDLPGGLKDCDEVLLRRPDLAQAYVYRGAGCFLLAMTAGSQSERENAFKRAIGSLDAALQRAPENQLAYYSRGLARYFRAMTNHVMVVYHFDSITVDLPPLDSKESQQLAEAEADFGAAIEIPDDSTVREEAKDLKTWIQALRGDPHGALSGMKSDSPFRAATYLLARDFPAAERLADQAIRRSGDAADVYAIRAAARFARRDLSGAREDLQAEIRVHPERASNYAPIIEEFRKIK